jgi:hypothetical protein
MLRYARISQLTWVAWKSSLRSLGVRCVRDCRGHRKSSELMDRSCYLSRVEGITSLLITRGNLRITSSMLSTLVSTSSTLCFIRFTRSPEAGGDKIPRKGGPGISQSDLLVINKVSPFIRLCVQGDLTRTTDRYCRVCGSLPPSHGSGREEDARCWAHNLHQCQARYWC